MKSVISLMSDIEKEADNIVKEAADKKIKMYAEYEKKIEIIDSKYKKMLSEELDNINSQCENTYEEEINKVRERIDDSIEELNEKYSNNRDEYVDNLFDSIIRM